MSLTDDHIIYDTHVNNIRTLVGITSDERYMVYINTENEMECHDLAPPNRMVWKRELISSRVELFEIENGKQFVGMSNSMTGGLIIKNIATGEEVQKYLLYNNDIFHIQAIFNNDTYLTISTDLFASTKTCSMYSLQEENSESLWYKHHLNQTVKVSSTTDYIINLVVKSHSIYMNMIDHYTGKDLWNGEIKNYKISNVHTVIAEISPTDSTMLIYSCYDMCLFCLDSKSVLWSKKRRYRTKNDMWIQKAKYTHDGSYILVNTFGGGVQILNLNGVMVWMKDGYKFAMEDTAISKWFVVGSERDDYFGNVPVIFSLRELYEPQVFVKLQTVKTVEELKDLRLNNLHFDIMGLIGRPNWTRFTKYGNIVCYQYHSKSDQKIFVYRNPLDYWTPNTHKFVLESKKERIETFFTVREIVFPAIPTEVMCMICEHI